MQGRAHACARRAAEQPAGCADAISATRSFARLALPRTPTRPTLAQVWACLARTIAASKQLSELSKTLCATPRRLVQWHAPTTVASLKWSFCSF